MDKSLYSRAGLGLGAIAAGALYNAFVGGNRAAKAISADRGLPMAYVSRRRAPARVRSRRPARPFNMTRRKVSFYRRMVRSTAITQAFQIPVGGSVGAIVDLTMGQLYTTDLVAMYRQFRLRKVVVAINPRVSPSNSGIANNYASAVIAACDPDGSAAPPATFGEVTKYNGWRSKILTGNDDKLYITIYPKALNVINGAAGAAVNVGGYATNPWISLDATGLAVPHKQLVMFGQNTGVALTFDYIAHFHFEVR